jgi:hypothetical protein
LGSSGFGSFSLGSFSLGSLSLAFLGLGAWGFRRFGLDLARYRRHWLALRLILLLAADALTICVWHLCQRAVNSWIGLEILDTASLADPLKVYPSK